MPKDVTKPKKDKKDRKKTSDSAAAAPVAAVASPADDGPLPKKKKSGKKAKEAATQQANESAPAVEIDTELDSLFKQSLVYAVPPPPPPPAAPQPPATGVSTSSKRKRDLPPHQAQAQPGKLSQGITAARAAAAAEAMDADDDSEDEEEGLEEAYEKKQAQAAALAVVAPRTAAAAVAAAAAAVSDDEADMAPDSGDEAGPSTTILTAEGFPMHETLLPGASMDAGKAKKVKAKRYVPEDETREDRDRRTIFVGNLGVEVAKSKPLLHLLHKHILASIPTAKIESTRFRSIAFSKPTEELPAETEKEEENRAKTRAKERARSWREEIMIAKEGSKGGEAEADKGKSYLTPGEKRKVAFIKKDFHPDADHVNAYIVFAYPAPDRSANVRPIMNPFEAAALAAQHCNGTTFENRTIRVDCVRANAALATTARATSTLWVAGTDPKKSIFVGNLEFSAKEEDVRAWFEKALTEEKGTPPKLPEGQGGEEGKWVSSVRIVRDRATGLGKGFAYVALRDRECVDEILALPDEKRKLAKRTLRVQRCKSLPSKPKSSTDPAVAPNSVLPTGSIPESFASRRLRPAAAGPIPKGNPKLGEAIKDLSKEDRKLAKQADADRMAHRMAKKKQKVAMERQLITAGGGKGDKVKIDKHAGGAAGKKKPGVGLKAKKSRVRSSAAAEKRNAKKA